MPNNITNIITFECTEEKFTEIAEFLRRDGEYLGTVDFNKLIPMPKDLDISAGSLGLSGLRMYREYLAEIEGTDDPDEKARIRENYLDREDDAPKALELGKQYFENIERYGAPTWYEWCIANWGTKWNAYDCDKADIRRCVLRFDTAWSAVPSIVKCISERYPEIDITYEWADEDIGSNVGSAVCRSGDIKEICLPEEGSKDAYEMAAHIMGLDLSEEGFRLTEDGKTYIYNWDEEIG